MESLNTLVWLCVEKRRWSLDFEVEGQRQKARPKRTWKEVEEESVKVELGREDALCQSK